MFIGIDLGTTNTTLSYLDNDEIKTFSILQIVSEGQKQELDQLPSFIYFLSEEEINSGDFDLPFQKQNYIVGEFAKKMLAIKAYRTISSAKSWLSTKTINRLDNLLPLGSFEGKISPVLASEYILRHLIEAWNYKNADKFARLQDLDIILTIPASFDPAAKELTIEAAKNAGLTKVTLLEEPQAALYSWLFLKKEQWRNELNTGDQILVCDLGGGTTDFSLIEAIDEGGNLELKRIKVGRHILLGGDNMDLALSHFLKNKLNTNLTKDQELSLISSSREAKEKLFLNVDLAEIEIVLQGSGSSLFKKSLKTSLSQEELKKIIIDGFFIEANIGDLPNRKPLSGLRQSGLDYATDARIFYHLAEFLGTNKLVNLKYVLLNGSMFSAKILKETMLKGIKKLTNNQNLNLLEAINTKNAVSSGASYFGQVLSGDGIRIRASLPFAYYIGVEKSQMAIPGVEPELGLLCIANKGMEEGAKLTVSNSEFCLLKGEAVYFRLFRSQNRNDQKGDFLDNISSDIEEVSGLSKTLASSADEDKLVFVNLMTELDNVGSLKIACIEIKDQNICHSLEFDLRES